VTFAEFEDAAWREWERIPEAYRSGVDGLRIERAARADPVHRDVYTLGECITESYPSDFGSADTTRSIVVLYYGSFFRLSRLDDEFDWDVELWETLTHELQHHLESLADDESLVDMDYAAEQNFRRGRGEVFDPVFFRHGIPERGWYRVEDEFFLELEWTARADITFNWHDRTYRVAVPDTRADVLLLTVSAGVSDAPGALHLALVRPQGVLDTLRRMLRPRPATIEELDVTAAPA
jgi:hypothetical protein